MIGTLILTLLISTATAQTKVAVLDTGLNIKDSRFRSVLCKTGHYDATGDGIHDYIGHGTHIVGLIKQYAENANYCIIVLKYYRTKDPGWKNIANLLDCYNHALKEGATVINLSLSGSYDDPEEANIIRNNPGVKFITSAGNNGQDLDFIPAFPASYGFSNIITVGNIYPNGVRHETSNYGTVVTKWEVGVNVESTCPGRKNKCKMTGTSQSTAIATGKYLKEISK